METAEKLPAIKQAKRRREASGRNRHLQSGRKGIEPMPINVPSRLTGCWERSVLQGRGGWRIFALPDASAGGPIQSDAILVCALGA